MVDIVRTISVLKKHGQGPWWHRSPLSLQCGLSKRFFEHSSIITAPTQAVFNGDRTEERLGSLISYRYHVNPFWSRRWGLLFVGFQGRLSCARMINHGSNGLNQLYWARDLRIWQLTTLSSIPHEARFLLSPADSKQFQWPWTIYLCVTAVLRTVLYNRCFTAINRRARCLPAGV